MADRMTFEVQSEPLIKALNDALTRLEHSRSLLMTVGATIEQNVAIRFLTKTDADGNRWLPLAPSTLARKKGKHRQPRLQRR